MADKNLMILTLETEAELSLDELCQACHIAPEYIYELIEHGALEPRGVSLETWRFSLNHLARLRRLLRLQRDLELNTSGAALALELIEQIESLQQQLVLFSRMVR